MFPEFESGTEDDLPADGNRVPSQGVWSCTVRPINGRAAVSFSREERLKMTAAFQRAWKVLLADERITAQNIEYIPTMLMEAIVDAAHTGERVSCFSPPPPSAGWRTTSVMN